MKDLFRRLTPKRLRRLDGAHDIPGDIDAATVHTIRQVQSATQTSPERIAALCEAIRYVTRNGIPGAIVECGVWRGGSMMASAMTLQECAAERDLYLFDTFSGMTAPTEHDVAPDGSSAANLLGSQDRADPLSIWCVSHLEEVRDNMRSTGYRKDRIHFIEGRVEETLPQEAPEKIALLRLDTDWYESTRHEMEQLFPRVVPGGVLIIDDYGHWEGARRAVDEYISSHGIAILLNRIDYTGRIGIVN